jgi:hypothetical protein
MKRLEIITRLWRTVGLVKTSVLILKETRRRILSFETVSIFQFDLTKNFEVPTSSISHSIRKLQDKDINIMLPLDEQGTNTNELKIRLERMLLIESQIPACYVVTTSNNEPCAMCWLIDHTSNEMLKRHYRGGIIELKENEVLCEGIYIRSAYRNKKLMQYLTFRLFEKAFKNGSHKAFAFIADKNKVSLKGSKVIGWEKVGIKRVRWILFNRLITYTMHTPYLPPVR